MEGIRIVHSAVHKASRVSKREGKWANIDEIKKKIPHATTFKRPVRPILNNLVKNSDIEKKRKFALWRPDDSGAMASSSSKNRLRDRRVDSDRDGRQDGRRPRGTGTKNARRTIAREVAMGAVGGAIKGSIRRVLF